MKTCKKCNMLKNFKEYYIDSSKSDGYKNVCKICSEITKKEKRKNINNLVNITNKICKTCNEIKTSNEFHKNKLEADGLSARCKICRKSDTKKYYQENKEIKKKQCNDYYHKNKEILRPKRQAYQNKIEKENILFKLSRRLRNRLYYALQRAHWEKGVKFNEYIGCSLDELKIHLEKQFKPDMTWNNYGKWHIDHIIPLSSAKTEEEMYKLCNFSNLQPLWALDNIKKSNKV